MSPLPAAAAILAAGRPRAEPIPTRPWLGRQSWQHMLLAHWAISAAELQAHLPQDVIVDTLDGTAWISIVAYRMAHVRLRGMPDILSLHFPQLNLRTYVVYKGRPGIYFFSLDAASALAVRMGAWVTGLPYHRAQMHHTLVGETAIFASERGPGGPGFAASFTPLQPLAAPTALDGFLTERYVFYASCAGGGVQVGAVCHGPWPLATVQATMTTNTLADGFGLDLQRAPDHLQYSSGVDVLFWRPKPL